MSEQNPGKKQGKSTAVSKPRHIRFRWEAEFMDSDLPMIARTCAWALCTFLNKDGTCWPSNAKIAKAMGCSESQAKRGKTILVERGWLRIVQKGTGAGHASTVEALIPAEKRFAREPLSEQEPVHPRPTTGSSRTDNRFAHEPRTSSATNSATTTTARRLAPVVEEGTSAVVESDGQDQDAAAALALIWDRLELSGTPTKKEIAAVKARMAEMGWSPQTLASVVCDSIGEPKSRRAVVLWRIENAGSSPRSSTAPPPTEEFGTEVQMIEEGGW